MMIGSTGATWRYTRVCGRCSRTTHEVSKNNEILDTIERTGRLSSSQASHANESLVTRRVGLAQDLVRLEGDIDPLNSEIFNPTVDVGDDLEVREWAMFMILVTRCLERISGNTIDIATRGRGHPSARRAC
jgi:phosphate transport system protein